MKLADLITKFLAYLLTEKRVSENTVIAYRQDLKQFKDFCTENALDISVLERTHYTQFMTFLKEKALSARSISRKIAALKGLFAYAQQYHDIHDYAQELIVPKMKRSLPHYLSLEELEQLFKSAEKDQSLMGKRNKAMLYLMYVTGMRVSELILLQVVHVHRDTATIAIEGKRGRQRLVPLPDSMMQELITYLDQIRPALLAHFKGTSEYLFPVVYGKRIKALTRQAFWFIIKQLWRTAGIARSISPHVLRHSFATHMLNKGANLRTLQMLLGHEQLATVQMYTHVETNHLRKIYDKKHPRS